MVVEKDRSLKTEMHGRAYYFCSDSCLHTFVSPEQELKNLKRRVIVAITGVVLLAILRGRGLHRPCSRRSNCYMGSNTKPSILYMGRVALHPCYTDPIYSRLDILCWRISCNKNQDVNMDFLIAMGTLVAYFYSTIVTFAPDILPVPVEERDVYFEVSAVIIAFVLLGKYMEEIIKKRSSAAVRKLLDLRPRTAKVIRDRGQGQGSRGDGDFVWE